MANVVFFWYTTGPLALYVFSVLSFVLKRKHLLNTLLSLESMMLSLFWFMAFSFSCWQGELFFVLYFLSLAACEGALGLSLLVYIVRSHGNDNFGEFSMLKC